MWAFLTLTHMGQGQALWAGPNWHLNLFWDKEWESLAKYVKWISQINDTQNTYMFVSEQISESSKLNNLCLR